MPGSVEQRDCSERTPKAIDAEVRQLLDDARQHVTATLQMHREQLEALARLLLEKETVDRAMLDAVLVGAEAEPHVEIPVTGAVTS